MLRKELRIYASDVIVSSDYHVPFHSQRHIQKLLDMAKKHNITDLIIAGDFLDCFKMTDFLNFEYRELTFKRELEQANRVLTSLSVFKNIYFLRGNHEDRFLSKLGGENDLSDLISLFRGELNEDEDYKVTNYDHCVLNDSWYICHPKNYSFVPLSVSKRLAEKYRMNVVAAHQHRLSLSKDASGKHFIIESGGLFDISKIEYLKVSSTYPMQVPGFVRICDNLPSLVYV